MAKSSGRFVKKDSVERYARRYGPDAAKKRFGSSSYSPGMRRRWTPKTIFARRSRGSETPGPSGSSGNSGSGGKKTNRMSIRINIKWGEISKFILFILFISLTIGFGMFGNILLSSISLAAFLIILYFTTAGTPYASIPKFMVIGIIIVGAILIPTTSWGQTNVMPFFSDAQTKFSESGTVEWFKNIINPGEELRKFGDFEDEEYKREGIGVELSLLDPKSDRFSAGEPIILQSKVTAASLLDYDSPVSFSCELDTYTGVVEIVPSENPGIYLPGRGGKLDEVIQCRFLDGLGERTTITEEAELTVTFDQFYSESTYPLVFVGSDEDGVDPRDYFGEADSFNIKNIANSKVSPGPVKIVLGIEKEQPFVAGGFGLTDSGLLEVRVDSDERVKLNNVESLKLFIPSDSISLRDDDQYCDFEPTGVDGIYDIYEPKEEVYEKKLNEQCTTQSCFREKRLIQLDCFFDVESFLEEGDIQQSTIGAHMTYSFGISRKKSITVRAIQEDDLAV